MQSIADILECPVCLEAMTSVIRQCQEGHSVCETCALNITQCPLCEAPITLARNYLLEKVIANLKEAELNQPTNCKYAKKGCELKYRSLVHLRDHEFECKKRDYVCEGKVFGNWKCDWLGNYEDIFQHFKNQHNKHSWMEFKTSTYMKIEFDRGFSDIQIIPYEKQNDLFWYKCKIDPWVEKAYWAIQYIGPKAEANKYFYEFTIKDGPLRLFKSIDICDSDSSNANLLFNSAKCVTVPFSTLKSYLNDKDEISFAFKIGQVEDYSRAEEDKKCNPKPIFKNNTSQGSPTSLQGEQLPWHGGIMPPANLETHFRRSFTPNGNFQYQGIPFSSQFEYGPHYGPQLMPPIMQYPLPQFRQFYPPNTNNLYKRRSQSK